MNPLTFAVRTVHTLAFGYYHLWYLAGMLGAALVMIAMARVSTRVLVASAIATFLAGVALQYAGSYQLLGTGTVSKFLSLSWSHRNFILFSYPFFCAGYLINQHNIAQHVSSRAALSVAVAGACLVFAESYLNFLGTDSSTGVDNLVSLALFCPALFILFTKLTLPTRHRELARYSTAIYLVHVLVIMGLQAMSDLGATLLTVLTVAVATALAALLIRLDRKLGFLL